MDELHERLAIPPDQTFHDRLAAELVARLTADDRPAVDMIEPTEEVAVLDVDAPGHRRRRLGPAVLGVAAVVVLAVLAAVVAVSRSGDPQPLGPNRPATGAPVTVGFLTEDADGLDARAARAAARYVNEHLGGIRGRPLELDVCPIDPPEAVARTAEAACADRFVAAKVPAVLHGTTFVLVTAESILTNLDVPLVTDRGGVVDGAGSARGSYLLGNGLGTVLAPAALAAETGVDRALLVVASEGVTDDHGYVRAVAELLRPWYERAGVELTMTGDLSVDPARLRTALSGTGQVQVIGEAARCGAVVQAVRAAAFRGPVYVDAPCRTSAAATAAGGALAGVQVLDDRYARGDGEDVVRYRAVLDAFDPGVDADDVAAMSGYRVVLAFSTVMAQERDDVTAATVRRAFATAPALPLALSFGQTFHCDGRQMPTNARACSSSVVASTLDAKGGVTAARVVDLSRILAP